MADVLQPFYLEVPEKLLSIQLLDETWKVMYTLQRTSGQSDAIGIVDYAQQKGWGTVNKPVSYMLDKRVDAEVSSSVDIVTKYAYPNNEATITSLTPVAVTQEMSFYTVPGYPDYIILSYVNTESADVYWAVSSDGVNHKLIVKKLEGNDMATDFVWNNPDNYNNYYPVYNRTTKTWQTGGQSDLSDFNALYVRTTQRGLFVGVSWRRSTNPNTYYDAPKFAVFGEFQVSNTGDVVFSGLRRTDGKTSNFQYAVSNGISKNRSGQGLAYEIFGD